MGGRILGLLKGYSGSIGEENLLERALSNPVAVLQASIRWEGCSLTGRSTLYFSAIDVLHCDESTMGMERDGLEGLTMQDYRL